MEVDKTRRPPVEPASHGRNSAPPVHVGSSERIQTVGKSSTSSPEAPKSPENAQKPANPQANIVCPPGLEALALTDRLLLHQVTRHSGSYNKFITRNAKGEVTYTLTEDSTSCSAVFFRARRSFKMDAVDYKDVTVMRFCRPVRCECCCLGCWPQEIEVQAPQGKTIAYVRQRWSIANPKFTVYDRRYKAALNIVGPLCPISMPGCMDVDFEVRSPNGVSIGNIIKVWNDPHRRLCAAKHYFRMIFPADMDVQMKAALIGASILIEYTFFVEDLNPCHVNAFARYWLKSLFRYY